MTDNNLEQKCKAEIKEWMGADYWNQDWADGYTSGRTKAQVEIRKLEIDLADTLFLIGVSARQIDELKKENKAYGYLIAIGKMNLEIINENEELKQLVNEYKKFAVHEEWCCFFTHDICNCALKELDNKAEKYKEQT